MSFLQDRWIQLVASYSKDLNLTNKLFSEIHSAYSESSRYYHNESHLESLLNLSDVHSSELNNKHVVDFSIFYHDVVYKSTRSDNEEQSAVMAQKRLAQLGAPPDQINVIMEFIRATKSHVISASPYEKDLAWFLDFDLSILGAEESVYFDYVTAIRKEFKIYPDILYKPGRRKVLHHFLEKEFIFKTETFRNRFEQKAKQNIKRELATL